MAKTLDVSKHTAFFSYKKAEKICKILFDNTPIKYFCYQQLFANGNYTFLPTQPDLSSYFYKDGAYTSSWLFNTQFNNIRSGFYLWDIAGNLFIKKVDEVDNTVKNKFGLKHGIDVIDKKATYFDIYSFASDNIGIYHYSADVLKRFIFYFRQEGQKLLHEVREQLIYLPDRRDEFILPIYNNELITNNLSDLFPVRKFYISDLCEDVCITKREKDCLEQLAKGKTAKETARILDLSYRTVESHVENIKIKFGCTRLIEAIKGAIKNGIIVC